MRRLLLILAGLATFLGVAAAPAAAAVTTTTCVSAAAFDAAAGTVTVTPQCGAQSVTLVSYTVVGTAGQFLYDSVTGKVTHHPLTLKVAVPGCAGQVVAYLGSGVQTEVTGSYGRALLGSGSSGGGACATSPAVTYAYSCDGAFTATLANGSDAHVPAVFLTGGRRIRLSPGRSTTVKVAKGSTLTVRDSAFTTHVASWQSPATGCTATAPTATPAIPPAAIPTTSASATTAPTTTATPTTAAATAPTYDAPIAYPTFPDKATTTTAAKTGLGAGSILLTALGLLMVGTGIAAITWLIRLNRRIA